VILLDWAFTLLGVGGMQATVRSIYEEIVPGNALGQRRMALVIDASPEACRVAERLSSRNGGDYVVSGVLDDDLDHYGTHVAGTRVIGGVASTAACAQRLRVSDVIVHRGSLYGARLERLCRECTEIRVRVVIAEEASTEDPPAAGDAGGVTVRPVELRDLLNHLETRLESHAAATRLAFADATVLVTGAGGSLGAEVCRLLATLGPRRILAVDRDELALAAVCEGHHGAGGEGRIPIEPILADVADPTRLESILRQTRPSTVFHIAAYGDAALLEAHPVAAARDNVLVAVDLAELAARHGVATLVVPSSAAPRGVKATASRALERALATLGTRSPTGLVVVRLGEVLDAAGGLVPTINRFLREGRTVELPRCGPAAPVVTLHESATLLLAAAAGAAGSGTFLADSGPPMPLGDLVEALAYLLRVPTQAVRTGDAGVGAADGASGIDALGIDACGIDPSAGRLGGTPLVRIDPVVLSADSLDAGLAALRDAARDGDGARVKAALRALAGDDVGGHRA